MKSYSASLHVGSSKHQIDRSSSVEVRGARIHQCMQCCQHTSMRGPGSIDPLPVHDPVRLHAASEAALQEQQHAATARTRGQPRRMVARDASCTTQSQILFDVLSCSPFPTFCELRMHAWRSAPHVSSCTRCRPVSETSFIDVGVLHVHVCESQSSSTGLRGMPNPTRHCKG